MSSPTLTTQAQVRAAFWEWLQEADGGLCESAQRTTRKRQNDYPTDVRCAFVDYVDMLARDGQITEALAQRVTL